MITEKQKANLRPAKKGEIRNPNGRPSKEKYFSELVRSFLNEKIETKGLLGFKDEDLNIPRKEVLMRALFHQATVKVFPDMQAVKILLEYGYGKPKETLKLEGEINIPQLSTHEAGDVLDAYFKKETEINAEHKQVVN